MHPEIHEEIQLTIYVLSDSDWKKKQEDHDGPISLTWAYL